MSQTKVAIKIDEQMLARIDALVKRKVFSSRSRAIQKTLEDVFNERSGTVAECTS